MNQTRFSVILLGVLGIASVGGAAQATGEAHTFKGNMPKLPATATDLGAVSPTATIDVTLWLNPHNKAELDTLAHDVTNAKSANFRHFLSPSEFNARFAPTAEEAATVQTFLSSHELKVLRVGTHNFYVRAQGTVANVSKAFHVQMNNFQLKGETVRGNVNEPTVEGPAGALVRAIYGLDSLSFKHPYLAQSRLLSSTAASSGGSGFSNAATATSTPPDSSFFTSNCFDTANHKGSFSDDGVTVSVKGNVYNPTGNFFGCGYTPAEIRSAYNLNALYKEGLDGTGQTIVIVDWCGSPTILSDANAFSAKFGLPTLTKKNFQIINFPTASSCAAPDAEINLDVEWAHTVAPGANIDLVVPPSPSYNDVDEAVFYAATNGLGNVISNSYGSEEAFTPEGILATEDLINEIAAIYGVSNNYSSGDSGDYTGDLNLPQTDPQSVSSPADSPYATAVGGVTLALTSTGKIAFQTGWGNNTNVLISEGLAADPLTAGNFYAGSGGGASAFFFKPLYQAALPGAGRQIPDISWLADPFTGAVIAISNPGVYPPLNYEVIGGTSLACPMFSALWAIANQAAGTNGPLGQAAPYLYAMPASTITDIVPFSSTTNVSAKETDPSGTIAYSANFLAGPLENTTQYYSAFWNTGANQLIVTFGTDTSLTVTPGWDNVTGLGVPNAKPFVDYFK